MALQSQLAPLGSCGMSAHLQSDPSLPREGYVPVENAERFTAKLEPDGQLSSFMADPILTTCIFYRIWIGCPIRTASSTTIREDVESL
jgi:hypothetical protein